MKLLKAIMFLTLFTFFGSSSFGQSQNIVGIPNIFTPNGDGINDIFRVNAAGFEEMTVTIYNRQGEQVYRFYGLKRQLGWLYARRCESKCWHLFRNSRGVFWWWRTSI